MRSLPAVLPLLLAVALPARPDEPPPEAVLADLPFLEHPEPSRIVIDLAPPDARRSLRFLVATGASHSVATPRAARELGIQVRRIKHDPYRRATLLGRDVQLWVDARSSDTASKTGWEYAMLGGQFLAEYVLELDFHARRVRLLDPERYRVPEETGADDEAVLPLVMRMNRPAVEIDLNGERSLLMIVTGAPPPLVLSGAMAERAGVARVDGPKLRAGSVLGPVGGELGRVEELRLGDLVVEDVPAFVSPRGWYNLAMPGESAIGFELLEHFQVRIDYPRRRVWLKRAPTAPKRFMGREYETFEDLLEQPEPAEPAT